MRSGSTSLSFSSRLAGERFRSLSRASYFCFGKSSQNHCAGHDDLADIASARSPLVLADRAPARTRPSLASDMRALLARSAARRGVMQRRGYRFDDGHPWPCSKRELTTCFVAPRAQEARRTGPLRRGETRTIRPAGRAQGIALAWPPRHGRRLGQARSRRTYFSTKEGRKAWRRGGLLFGDFLLAAQEKVTRARGTRTEQDRDVIPPMLRIDPLPAEGGVFAHETSRTADTT